jgi:transposase
MSRKQVATIFLVDIKTVYSDMQLIRNSEVSEKRKWGGGNNYLMTFEEETQFLDNYLLKAQEGHIITMPYLHEEYNRQVGKKTPKSTFYRMLKRHDWRKVLPDTRHPKGDPEVQEEFKKKHSKFKWIKL